MGLPEKIFDQFNHPVFIENAESKDLYLNKAAELEFNQLPNKITRKQFDKEFPIRKSGRMVSFCSYSENIYLVSEEKLSIEQNDFKKISLSRVDQILDPDLLEHYMTISEQFVHQFRSPLTSVSGYVELLLKMETSEKKIDYLKKLEKALEQSFTLLKQAEHFAHPVNPNIAPFQLKIFRHALLESIDRDDRKRIRFTFPDHACNIISDFDLFLKISKELLKNALEATDQPIDITLKKPGTLQFGNPVKNLTELDFDKLFLPYYTTKALHMGLGLPACQYFCHKLGLPLQVHFSDDHSYIMFQIRNIPLLKSE